MTPEATGGRALVTTKGRQRQGYGYVQVYGVVKQLGGDVTVESTPLQGSTFTVLLPVTAKEPEVVHEAIIPGLASGGGETVLLVEDDAPVRALLNSVLKRHGYDVLVANGAREALSIAARQIGSLDLGLGLHHDGDERTEMVGLLKNTARAGGVVSVRLRPDALVTDRVMPDAVRSCQKHGVGPACLLEDVRLV